MKIFRFLLILLALLVAQNVLATNIYIYSDKASVLEGESFGASVYVDTLGQSINNAEGVISFPADSLQVESISNGSSVFKMWIEQPTFNNAAGVISFNGGIPTPGYKGGNGHIFRINFKAKKSGNPTISFSSVSILLNDGMGTEAAQNKIPSTVIIRPNTTKQIQEVTPVMQPLPPITPIEVPAAPIPVKQQEAPAQDKQDEVKSVVLPDAPVINSPEMVDSEAWYALNKFTLSWELSKGITASQILSNKKSDSTPNITNVPPISKKEFVNSKDGTWYFHLRLKNSKGWSDVAHRKINIDNSLPFDLTVSPTVNEQDLVSLSVLAKDAVSGIGRYSVDINGEAKSEIKVDNLENSVSIVLPPLKSGDHTAVVRAFDKAGNNIEKRLLITAPKIKVPEITKYPPQINKGQVMEIGGNAFYGNSNVRIWVKEGSEEPKLYNVQANSSGGFSAVTDAIYVNKKVGAGEPVVYVWAEVERAPGVISDPSDKKGIKVYGFGIFDFKLSSDNAGVLSIVIPLIVLLFMFLAILYYEFYKFKKVKQILNRDLVQTESEVGKVLEVIQNDVKNSQKMLKKMANRRSQAMQEITTEEARIFHEMAQNIEMAEKYFEQRMKHLKDK